MITGSIVALATPMKVNGDIDWEALRRLVNFHLDNGTDAIVAAGTTGEPTTMSFAEHFDVIRSVVEEVNGRIPVIAATVRPGTLYRITGNRLPSATALKC